MELRHARVADERHGKAFLAAARGKVQKRLLAVHVDADLGYAGVKPVGEGGAVLIGVVNVDPVLSCANLAEPSLTGKGHEGGLHAGMARLGGNLALAHL